jgi:hypothetical protein
VKRILGCSQRHALGFNADWCPATITDKEDRLEGQILSRRAKQGIEERRGVHHSPSMRRTPSWTLRSYSSLRSRHILAASTLAGLSSLGSASMLMTLMRIFSTDWMGDQRSEACS